LPRRFRARFGARWRAFIGPWRTAFDFSSDRWGQRSTQTWSYRFTLALASDRSMVVRCETRPAASSFKAAAGRQRRRLAPTENGIGSHSCLQARRQAAPGEAYGGFEIEHFRPKGRAAFEQFRNSYRNLLWACHACNRAKGQKWPTKEDRAFGMRFVDPCKEGMGLFLRLSGDRVEPVDARPVGIYVIGEINLNSQTHVTRRRERARVSVLIAQVEARCAVLRSRLTVNSPPEATDEVAHLETLVAELQAMLRRDGLLQDAPSSCLCGVL
jgi:hypothetical protein